MTFSTRQHRQDDSRRSPERETFRRREDGSERRTSRRFRTSEPACVLVSDNSLHCRLTDISEGGAQIEGQLPLETGSSFTLGVIDMPELPAQVVRRQDGVYGVRFQSSPGQRRAVSRWITRHLRAA